MDITGQMLSFVKVVEMGSISAASRADGQTPSAISKQMRQLEDHVGHRLLHRTPAGVALTREGRLFYEKCRAVAQSVAEAEAHITSLSDAPKGVLRVTSSVAFGKAQLMKLLPGFLARYPEITLSLELSDRKVDLEAEKIDVAISFAEQQANPGVITRRIMKNTRILVASPAFLARNGTPGQFSDLKRFNCLRTSDTVGRNAWRAVLNGVEHMVDASGNFEGNSADVVYRATLAGLGVARLSSYLVADDLAAGRLVRVLPEYRQDHADVALAFAERRNLPPRTRALVDFLVEQFSGTAPATRGRAT